MDTFSFLSVVFSVIIGLAMTEIMQGLRKLILARKRVIIFWPSLIWAGLMIFVIAQNWWGMFQMRDFRQWNMAMYAAVVFQTTLMYLSAGMVIPEVPEHGPVDLRVAYFEHNGWFFGLLASTIAATFFKDFILNGHIAWSGNTTFLTSYFSLSLIGALTKKPWFHWFLAPFSVAAITTYTALLSFRL